jgi:hypothetical protein
MKFPSPLNEMGISYKYKVYNKKFKIYISLGPTICSTTNNKKFEKVFHVDFNMLECLAL